MARIGHGIEELLEAWNAADILGRCTARAVNKAGIIKLGIGNTHVLDGYGMPPVIAEVIGVRECAGTAFDQGAELDIFCVESITHVIPLLIGDSISSAADVEPEEVIILEWHHRLDDVVQTLQACGQWDLDPSPNRGISTFEFG